MERSDRAFPESAPADKELGLEPPAAQIDLWVGGIIPPEKPAPPKEGEPAPPVPPIKRPSLRGEATLRLTEAEGRPPEGWLGPWISHSHVTPDLLAEAGYRYLLDWCMDDQPIWFACRGERRILAVPYPQEVNDIPQIVGRKVSGAAFADIVVDQFDEMLELSRERPLVMGVALHAYLVGQPHRLRHLKRALRHIARHREQIWLTTPGAIAQHCASLPAGVVP